MDDELNSLSSLFALNRTLVNDVNGRVRFFMTHQGVQGLVIKKERNGTFSERTVHVCGQLELVAEARSERGDRWAKIFRFKDRDGTIQEVILPLEMLAGDGVRLREILIDRGLFISPSRQGRELLLEYISTVHTTRRVELVEKVGWHGDTFVTANGVIGKAGSESEIRFEGRLTTQLGQVGGSFEAWINQIAKPSRGNSRLIFAICVALAAPLLKLTNSESGIFHLVGQSSKGKTTALNVAGSVWGGGGGRPNVKSWRATSNGLEGLAAAHNDSLLCLDELSQIKGSEASASAYMLANGIGKQRADRGGQPRPPQEWKILVLSSGEVDLDFKISEDDRLSAAAGQLVRAIDLPADAQAGMGLFERLDTFTSAEAMAVALNRSAVENYGHLGPRFISQLSSDLNKNSQTAVRLIEECLSKFQVPEKAGTQVKRVARRFALVAAAGEMAVEMGLLPWAAGEVTEAVRRMLGDWLDRRGGLGDQEVDRVIAQVRHYLHSNERIFYGAHEHDEHDWATSPERKGFKKKFKDLGECYCFPVEIWNRDVCKGLDPRLTAKILRDSGYLVSDTGGLSKTIRHKEKLMKVYAVRQTLLAPEDNQPSPNYFTLFGQDETK